MQQAGWAGSGFTWGTLDPEENWTLLTWPSASSRAWKRLPAPYPSHFSTATNLFSTSTNLFSLESIQATSTYFPFSLPFYIQIKEPSHCMCYMHVESCIKQLCEHEEWGATECFISASPSCSSIQPHSSPFRVFSIISLKAFQRRDSASVMSPQIPVVVWTLNK